MIYNEYNDIIIICDMVTGFFLELKYEKLYNYNNNTFL